MKSDIEVASSLYEAINKVPQLAELRNQLRSFKVVGTQVRDTDNMVEAQIELLDKDGKLIGKGIMGILVLDKSKPIDELLVVGEELTVIEVMLRRIAQQFGDIMPAVRSEKYHLPDATALRLESAIHRLRSEVTAAFDELASV